MAFYLERIIIFAKFVASMLTAAPLMRRQMFGSGTTDV